MLEIKQLSVAIDGMEILQGINLDIGTGETHVLFGPNGSGKTALLMAIMGFPRYQVTKGNILFKGKDIQGEGVIYAIPELKGTLDGINLSHEAAVGKIAEEEVEYLMARGLIRTEATATIVRGFLKVDIEGLPPLLSAELQRTIESSGKDLM